jgi:hypothetical protein
MFGNGFSKYIDATYPGGLDGFAAWIKQQNPTYLVVQSTLEPDWLAPLLREDYRQVAAAPNFTWWVRASVPQDVQDRIHQANIAALRRARS